MEGQSSDSPHEQQSLETKLTNMLQNVKPPDMHGFDMQCIYRAPPRIRETNSKAYTPRIVSIGPFHKKDTNLESMEEFKLKYLKAFLNRFQPLSMGTFVTLLKSWEEKIRSCYAEPIQYNSDDFLKMILVDACFIIELFLRFHGFRDWEGEHPVLPKQRMQIDIMADLIVLENQLPFFVLEHLYNQFTGMSQEFPSFLKISIDYFKCISFGTVSPTESPNHFTDLLRSLISSSNSHLRTPEQCKVINHLCSASQLWEAGLKFKSSPNQNESLINLTYSDEGVLTMPSLNIHDGTEMLLRNILAFEECHNPDEKIITQYMTILDFLINTEKDVNILVDKKIIVNWMGDANEVATMVNSLCSNIAMPYLNPQYVSVCNSLNKFYKSPRNKYKAIFLHEYFNTPWKIASTIAAFVLLLLTFIQTICSIISLF